MGRMGLLRLEGTGNRETDQNIQTKVARELAGWRSGLSSDKMFYNYKESARRKQTRESKAEKSFRFFNKEFTMKFFLDTANLDEIREAASLGVLDGVTTNPSLIAKEKADFKKRTVEICEIVQGPVSAEVTSRETEEM